MFSETWKHEGGIASTRLSQRSGESIYAYVQTARQAMIGLFLESFDGGDFCFILIKILLFMTIALLSQKVIFIQW